MGLRISALIALALGLVQVGEDAASPTIKGVVTHVRDGDTIVVGQQPVRIWGISAPELSELGGKESGAYVRWLVKGREVTCEPMGKRSHDRVVAICHLGGVDIGKVIVQAAWARDCPRFSKGRYAKDEQPEAKRFRLPGYCEVM